MSIKIPKYLKCWRCGGKNFVPDPAVYFSIHLDGFGCCDCQGDFETEREERARKIRDHKEELRKLMKEDGNNSVT